MNKKKYILKGIMLLSINTISHYTIIKSSEVSQTSLKKFTDAGGYNNASISEGPQGYTQILDKEQSGSGIFATIFAWLKKLFSSKSDPSIKISQGEQEYYDGLKKIIDNDPSLTKVFNQIEAMQSTTFDGARIKSLIDRNVAMGEDPNLAEALKKLETYRQENKWKIKATDAQLRDAELDAYHKTQREQSDSSSEQKLPSSNSTAFATPNEASTKEEAFKFWDW